MRYSFWPLLYSGLRTGFTIVVSCLSGCNTIPCRRTVTRENNCFLSRRSYNTKVCEIDPLSKKCDFSKWCMPSLYNSCLMIGRNYDNKIKRRFSWHCLVNSNDWFCTFSIAFWHVPLSVRSVIIVALYTSTCWYATFLS